MARTSLSWDVSAEMTNAMICVSWRQPAGNSGRIGRSMKRLVVKEPPAAAAAPVAATIEQRGNANPLFPPAFFSFLKRGGRALMLFSEKDRLQSEYEEKFAAPFAVQLQPYLPQLHQHVVSEANHVLSFTPWQQEMIKVSRDWLESLHGGKKA